MTDLSKKSVEVLKMHAENKKALRVIDEEIIALDEALTSIKSPRLDDVSIQSGASDPAGAMAYLLDTKESLLARRCVLVYKIGRVDRALSRIEKEESTILEMSFIFPSKKEELNYSPAQFYKKRCDALGHFARAYGFV